MEEGILKERLAVIKAGKFEPDKNERWALALEMLEKIGVTDFDLREILIYYVFANWIENGVFDSVELRKILEISMDEKHMFYKIGEDGTDSAFTRTFSVLMVASTLYRNNANEFLTKEEVDLANEKVVRYMKDEKDLRGYVEGIGWAHSAAHTADALAELARCPKTGEAELKKILDAIRFKALSRNYTFVDKEDERMVTAVVNVLDRNILSSEDFGRWLKGFEEFEFDRTDRSNKNLKITINAKGFLRSLYFRTLGTDNFRYLEENGFLGTLKTVSYL